MLPCGYMKKAFLVLTVGAFLTVGLAVTVPTALRAAPRAVGGVDSVTNYSNWGNAGARTTIAGWAADTTDISTPVSVVVTSPTLGGQVVDEFKTSITRLDAQTAYGGSALKGFEWVIPARFYTGQKFDFNFYMKVGNDYLSYPIGFKKGVMLYDAGFRASVDRLTNNSVNGWALDLDGDDLTSQTTAVFVTIDGQQVAMGLTGARRDDVGHYWRTNGYPTAGNNHGYSFNIDVPSRFRDNKAHTFHVFALEFTEGTITQIGGPLYRTIKTDGTFGTN